MPLLVFGLFKTIFYKLFVGLHAVDLLCLDVLANCVNIAFRDVFLRVLDIFPEPILGLNNLSLSYFFFIIRALIVHVLIFFALILALDRNGVVQESRNKSFIT